MKKIITLLLTSLMIFTLVGCSPKPIEEQPVEVEPAQVIEPTESETILGGWIDVEDGALTDELKDIFSKALEGLLGSTYEPVKLLAKQVVNGTNYKFLANGTKTTNPITVGTYNITINESSDGTISLVDIETIEESSATPLVDNTQMSYWVVFYDQYGNELQRTIEKYGTVPSFKGTLPSGFDKWVNKNTQKDVDTFKAITTNTYFEAVCYKVEDDDQKEVLHCDYKGEHLYYIFDKIDTRFYACLFVYNSSTEKYEVYNESPIWYFKEDFLSGLKVGDWLHYNRGSEIYYGKCYDNGHGTDIPVVHTVTFDTSGITFATGTFEYIFVLDGEKIDTNHFKYTASGYTFDGWYKEPTCENKWDPDNDLVTQDTTLYAKWIDDTTVTVVNELLPSDFPSGNKTNVADIDGAWNIKDTTAYCAINKQYSNKIVFQNGVNTRMISLDQALTYIDENTWEYNDGTVTFTFYVPGGDLLYIDLSGAAVVDNKSINGTYVSPKECFAEGTLIVMADGSRKKVEDIKKNELVLAFNHETGDIEKTPVFGNFEYKEKNKGLFTLNFSNGSSVRVVGGHCFFEKEANKYVEVTITNYKDYIGHKFYNAELGDWVELSGVETSNEKARTFIFVTKNNLNCLADGMLSNEDGIYTALANVFKFNSDLTINQEDKAASLKEYGLWCIEDQDYITDEMIEVLDLYSYYDGLNFKYFNILDEKGLLGYDIKDLILYWVVDDDNYIDVE